MATDMAKLVGEVAKLLNGSDRVEVDVNDPQVAAIIDDLHKARVRLELSHQDITVDFPQGGSTTLVIRKISAAGKKAAPSPSPSPDGKKAKAPSATPPLKRYQHTYVVPTIARDMLSVLTDEASHVVWLTGPTQCGKDRMVHYCGRELGRKVHHINCRGDIGS